jgi:hypothetical protein
MVVKKRWCRGFSLKRVWVRVESEGKMRVISLVQLLQ